MTTPTTRNVRSTDGASKPTSMTTTPESTSASSAASTRDAYTQVETPTPTSTTTESPTTRDATTQVAPRKRPAFTSTTTSTTRAIIHRQADTSPSPAAASVKPPTEPLSTAASETSRQQDVEASRESADAINTSPEQSTPVTFLSYV